MNGEPIRLAHGGLLRLIVPGCTCVNNVTYIKRLAFAAEQCDAAIQKTGYRISPPGDNGDPSQPSVWEMGPEFWIDSPAPKTGSVPSGMVKIKGMAFGGMTAVKPVAVSVDDGTTWKALRHIGPDLGKYAWRQFVLPFKLKPIPLPAP